MSKTHVMTAVVFVVLAASTAFGKTVECATPSGFFTGFVDANVVVPTGQFCIMIEATVTGSVRVEPGAVGFHAHRSTIGGNVDSPGDIVFDIRILDSRVGGNVNISKTHEGTVGAICRSTIGGDLHWDENTGGFETIGIGFPLDVCTAGNTFLRNVVLSNNSGRANFDFNNNKVLGNVIVNNNKGSELIHDNQISGVLVCESNDPAPVSTGNTAGSFHGQCQPAPVK